MTTEQKAKAYDKALEKAKYLHEAAANGGYDIDVKTFECLFPELKESEDERIREALIENFKWFCGDYPETSKWGKDDNLLVKDIIAWLEKQGSQKLANSAKTCKDEQKPTDEEIKTLLRTEYEKGRADAIAEIKKSAWSKEDEEELDIAISTLKEAGQHDSAEWLKSLKERIGG